jgi:DNA-binding transcriptional ArsR family regulator
MTDQKDKFIQTFKALANEERLEILKLLHQNKEMYAQTIEKHFYLEQSTTSHHLNTLRRSGIIQSRKEGRRIYYSINYQALNGVLSVFSSFFKS